MEVRTRSVKGRQFWRASGGHIAIIIVASQLSFFGNGSGVNLEEKSGVGVPKAVCCCSQPHSGNSCDVAGAKL